MGVLAPGRAPRAFDHRTEPVATPPSRIRRGSRGAPRDQTSCVRVDDMENCGLGKMTGTGSSLSQGRRGEGRPGGLPQWALLGAALLALAFLTQAQPSKPT